MGRGGARVGAGKKTSWPSGCRFPETKSIRVPEYLSVQLLEVARKLDAGEVIDFESKSKIEQLEKIVSDLQKKNEQLEDDIGFLKSRLNTVESRPKRTEQKEHGIQLNLLNQEESNESNELVSESKTVAVNTLLVLPLTVKDLAKRLRLGTQAVTNKLKASKGRESEFSSWSKKRDPDNVAWIYRKEEELFYPSLPKG